MATSETGDPALDPSAEAVIAARMIVAVVFYVEKNLEQQKSARTLRYCIYAGLNNSNSTNVFGARVPIINWSIHSPGKVYGLTLLNHSSLTFSASTSGNFTPRPRSCMESSNVTIAFL